jgi:hypothetical protein
MSINLALPEGRFANSPLINLAPLTVGLLTGDTIG